MSTNTLSMFDKKDLQLLYELDSDCRQSDAKIGRKLKLSKQTVRYRIQRLLKEGWITRFASVVDTYKLGFYKFKLYLSFKNADKDKIQEITDYLVAHKKTEWIASCSGKWDCIVGFIVKTPYEFDEAVRELEQRYSSFMAFREVTIALGVPHWKKEYLLDKKPPYSWEQQGGFLGDYQLDEEDEKIIRLIVNNSRMPVVEMAKKLKMSARTITYRLRKLRKDKIILMQRIFLNLPKLNFIFCKALIKFKNLTKEKYGKFFAVCSDIPNLVYLINCTGSWDVELDFEMPDFNIFHKVMLDLRDRFPDIIASYDFAIVLNEEKLDYYPGSESQIK
ncbi:AsnC family transcriptional regulator [Candidatus Woesearchaeota archaeon]|nr:AsnC family transcriptional regulator [Candidatus Woesearchaeota archaeon]